MPHRVARRSQEERAGRSFLRGVGETACIVAGFVVAGLLAGALAAPARTAPPGARAALPYIGEMAEETPPPRVWLVDGFNALHVAVLRGRERAGWWTREGREQLLARVRSFEDPSAEIWVVFDGPHPIEDADGAGAESGGPRVAFARSADAWLLQRVREARAGEVAVVTADRPLAARARARGARVVSPREFLARCGGSSSSL